jgi:hypothetical protein
VVHIIYLQSDSECGKQKVSGSESSKKEKRKRRKEKKRRQKEKKKIKAKEEHTEDKLKAVSMVIAELCINL